MSLTLDTGAIKGWWRPRENIRHNREVPWETSPVGWHHHTEETSVEILTYTRYLPWPDYQEGWVGHWIDKLRNQALIPYHHTEGQDSAATQCFMQICQEHCRTWMHWLEINFVKITFSLHVDFSVIVSCTLKIYPLLIGSWNNANKLQTSSFLGVSF